MQNFCNGIATCKFMLYNVIIVEIYSQFDVLCWLIYINVIKKLVKCIFWLMKFGQNAEKDKKDN